MRQDNIIIRVARKTYRLITNAYLKRKLKNKNFTILAPTCIGGVIYHHLGLKFLSPTVNLWMTEDDLYKFVMDLEYYISQEVEFFAQDIKLDYPIGIIRGKDESEDVLIQFNHHKSFVDAKAIWDVRKQRINWSNLYVIASTRGGETNSKITRWENVKDKVNGLVLFTAHDYPNIPYALQLTKFKDREYCPSYMMEGVSKLLSKHAWEKDFNFVRWLNNGTVK